jgi:Tetratricopeptide repeat
MPLKSLIFILLFSSNFLYAQENPLDKISKFSPTQLDSFENLTLKKIENTRSEIIMFFHYTELSVLYSTSKKNEKAEEMILKSIVLLEKFIKTNPKEFEKILALEYTTLGLFYSESGQYVKAVQTFTKSFALYEKLILQDTSQTRNFSSLLINFGDLYSKIEKSEDFKNLHQVTIEFQNKLTKLDSLKYKKELAYIYMQFSLYFYRQQNYIDSEKFSISSLSIYEILYPEDSTNYEKTLSGLYSNTGSLYYTINKYEKSEKYYLKSLTILEKLAKINPSENNLKLAQLVFDIGVLYSNTSKQVDSERMYLRSLDLFIKNVDSTPSIIYPKLANIYMNLGLFYSSIERQEEAISQLTNSLSIYDNFILGKDNNPPDEYAYTLNNLGYAYLKNNNLENARDCLSKSEKLKPKNSWVFKNWACFYALEGKTNEALENLKKAADLGFDDIDWVKNEKLLEPIRQNSGFNEILKKILANK